MSAAQGFMVRSEMASSSAGDYTHTGCNRFILWNKWDGGGEQEVLKGAVTKEGVGVIREDITQKWHIKVKSKM